MRYEDENIWLTQKMMATLYDVGTNTINYHIKKIFEDSELQEDSVIRKFRITASDGIREIRASERKFYQKITDLFATAIDYDKNSATTRRFYATVQNKMHVLDLLCVWGEKDRE